MSDSIGEYDGALVTHRELVESIEALRAEMRTEMDLQFGAWVSKIGARIRSEIEAVRPDHEPLQGRELATLIRETSQALTERRARTAFGPGQQLLVVFRAGGSMRGRVWQVTERDIVLEQISSGAGDVVASEPVVVPRESISHAYIQHAQGDDEGGGVIP